MAVTEISTQAKTSNPAAAQAAWAGVLHLEDLAMSLERLREMTFALACSETYDEPAQHAFYCVGEVVAALHVRAKGRENEMAELSEKYRDRKNPAAAE